jgi:osmotically-inducible protein OsmY
MLAATRGERVRARLRARRHAHRPLATDQWLEARAIATLEGHAHFHGRSQFVHCHCVARCLELEGCVPCYYLRQLAQEAVKGIEGIERVDNRIVVASPVGEVEETPQPCT